MRGGRIVVAVACAWFVVGLGLRSVADAGEEIPTVGVNRTLESVILPGPELVVKPLKHDSKLVLRITATFVHGTDFRYDFEYYALESGSFDLASYLVSKDGTPTRLPEVIVEVRSLLEPGQVTPNTLVEGAVPDVGGYRNLLIVGSVVWVIVLGLLFFWRRRRAATGEEEAHVVTLAERLRPLVEKAIRGELPPARHAELERTLLAFWRDRLGLADTNAADAILEMKRHEEAGRLLRELERWLHRPGTAGEVDVTSLLQPYTEG
jgi:hypothetical protein